MSAHIPVDTTEIKDIDQLTSYMLSGSKPSSEWVIGTEHEKIGWSIHEGRRPSYGGPHGIGQLLTAFESEGWTAQREGNAIVALTRPHPLGGSSSLTLEPGGQFELSGAPLAKLTSMADELDQHLADMQRLSEPSGIIWSGLGSDPTPPDLTPKMPKSRYTIMRRYLGNRGPLALHMMHSTATTQCNLDFSSEADAMKKLRLSLYIQPIVMAMSANSFLIDQTLQEGNCARAHIWLNTDDDRYVYPASFLACDTSLQAYVEWALEVPMFFFARDGEYIDCAGLRFSQFMREGYQEHSATLGDFALHLSTLFPDARLKTHLEVRGADMSNADYVKAISAFHVGLLYDTQALDQSLALFESVSAEELWQARASLHQESGGLETTLKGQKLLQWAQRLVDLSRDGLSRWEPDALPLINPLEALLSQGKAPADVNRPLWDKGVGHLMRETRVC